MLTFGNIDGIKIGQIFNSREDLSKSGIHAPYMGGIWGNKSEGACSIVLSGGYEDDEDELNYVLYTGHGGQDKPGGKQIADQEFTGGNKGLQLSNHYQLPVRITRGFQIGNGPESGYRYDGLYFVTEYERVRGKSGFYVCRFHLESEIEINDLENKLKNTLKPSYARVERVKTQVNRLNRNISLSEKVKEIYNYRCQICNVFLKSPQGGIVIGAHIKGLGKPHNGPDVIENMMSLCPNHHSQFDMFSFYIDPITLKIIGLENYEGKKINISKKHKIEKDFLAHHQSEYYKKNS